MKANQAKMQSRGGRPTKQPSDTISGNIDFFDIEYVDLSTLPWV